MKQSLQLRIGQSLTMTPQLQQAIKLLQMSTLDLQQEIQQALESNMMLEVEEEDLPTLEYREKKTENTDQVTSEGSQTDLPDELPVDVSWDDVYESMLPVGGDDAVDSAEFETFRGKAQTLQDHLIWQLELTHVSERDYAIAVAIIDAINDDGYVAMDLNEIHQGLLEQLDDVEMDEVRAV